jgi:hypothetical protein
VTTLFPYFVGRSVVSAMTQTPASGPLGPVTTPPMSSLSMATGAAAGACALDGDAAAMPTAATPENRMSRKPMLTSPAGGAATDRLG